MKIGHNAKKGGEVNTAVLCVGQLWGDKLCFQCYKSMLQVGSRMAFASMRIARLGCIEH